MPIFDYANGRVKPDYCGAREPPQHDCNSCGHGGVGMRVCQLSGYTADSPKALQFCNPAPPGYVPVKDRPE